MYYKLFSKNWVFTNRVRRRITGVEFIDTNFENWISIDQDLRTFGILFDKE